MKANIHVESPEGELINDHTKKLDDLKSGREKNITNDGVDNAKGPKANPDPRANANLPASDQHDKDDGAGTEVTDGEAG